MPLVREKIEEDPRIPVSPLPGQSLKFRDPQITRAVIASYILKRQKLEAFLFYGTKFEKSTKTAWPCQKKIASE